MDGRCAMGLCVAVMALGTLGVASAGPLNPPPGPVAPTGRTPITSIPFTIGAPGVYYLTANVTAAAPGDGITVNASGVTIDLGGFTIQGDGGLDTSDTAIQAGPNRIEVMNGSISGWNNGIISTGTGCRLRDLRLDDFASEGSMGINIGHDANVARCAVDAFGAGGGIRVGDRSSLTDCSATGGAGDGLWAGSYARILRCSAAHNSLETTYHIKAGPWSWVEACTVTGGFTVAECLNVGSDSTVLGCIIDADGPGPGIVAGDRSSVRLCRVTVEYFAGISLGSGGTVAECRVVAGDPAIQLTGGACLAVDNHVAASESGIQASGAGHFIARNMIGAGTPMNVAPGSIVGPLISMPGGGTITTTNPWANFSW